MDPASTAGLAAGTVTLLRLLGQGVLSVKAVLHGVRDVSETSRGLAEELDAFHFSLTILDFEIRNGSMIPEIQGWWGTTKLDALLRNARKTFLRLETIFRDIHRNRSILKPREYGRANLHNQEISHLRLRINTYTLSFNIPVVLLAIHGIRNPSRQVDQNLNLSLLGDRISQLEEGIGNISNDINAFNARYAANESSNSPQVEFRESEELVEIARTLVSNASSVMVSESAQSTPSTMRAFDPASPPEGARATARQENPIAAAHSNIDDGRQDASYSVIGVPLTAQRRTRIESWIPQPQTNISPDLPSGDLSSMPDIASITFTETSKISRALHTPPSTINGQDDGDIETELIKRRYKRAKELMEQQKFREAIPHLKRTLDVIKAAGESPVFQETRAYQEVQFLLATALMDTEPNLTEAKEILRELLESAQSEPLERFSAAHLLAQLYLNQRPDDFTEAKTLCLMAVKGRNATLGRTHPKTYTSIALLCSICNASNDSDEELWRDMLPEEFRQRNVDVWNVRKDGDVLRRTLEGHSGPVCAVAFSPDGQLVASGSKDKTIRLWDAATGEVCRTLEGHSNPVWAVAFSPDGRLVASGSCDNTVRLWGAATGAVRRTLEGHSNSVCAVAFSSDGRLVASGSKDNTIRLWDAATGAVRRTLEGHSNAVAFSPDGRLVASGFGKKTVRLWDAATGKVRRTLEGHSNFVYAVAFSPDSRLVASGSVDTTVKLWDAATGEVRRTLEGHSSFVCAVAFSPDGRLVASGSWDKTVKLWDAATGEVCHTIEGHSSSVSAIAFSPDGRLIVSGSGDTTVKLWGPAS